jgi:DNA-binding MarR family transcriptional regulator
MSGKQDSGPAAMGNSAARKRAPIPSRSRTKERVDAISSTDMGESVDLSISESGSAPNEAVRGYLHLHYGSGIIIKKVNQHLAQWDLSVSRYSILRLLLNHEAMTLSELSKSHVCVAGNITALINRLERDGLVRRVSDHDDKRVTRVGLTAKARTVLRSAIEPHRRFLESLMGPLDPNEIRALAKAIDALAKQAGIMNPSVEGPKNAK